MTNEYFRKYETLIHRRYKHLRIKGEWYSINKSKAVNIVKELLDKTYYQEYIDPQDVCLSESSDDLTGSIDEDLMSNDENINQDHLCRKQALTYHLNSKNSYKSNFKCNDCSAEYSDELEYYKHRDVCSVRFNKIVPSTQQYVQFIYNINTQQFDVTYYFNQETAKYMDTKQFVDELAGEETREFIMKVISKMGPLMPTRPIVFDFKQISRFHNSIITY
jgi:hypothetical protein